MIEIFTINQHKVNNIKLEMINITLNASTWKIYGLNVLIQKAAMVKTQLVLESFAMKKYFNFLTIYKSKFYSLRVNSGYNITISECQFIDDVTLESTIIKVYNSVLNITNSTFRNIGKSNSGSAIIDATNSLVLIKSVNVSDNYASNGLIEIADGSHLQVERSIFKRNGYYMLSSSVISIKKNSTVTIYNCKFVNNAALYGACFTVGVNTTLMLYNSTFYDNSAVRGGVIFHQETQYSKFYKNEPQGKPETWFSIAERQGSLKHSLNSLLAIRCQITGCYFENEATEGGDIYIQGTYFQVSLMKSNFSSFAGVVGGSVLMRGTDKNMADVLISQCIFESETVVEGGSIYVERTNMNIIDSHFIDAATFGPGEYILATNYSVVNITNSTFGQSFVSIGCISIRGGVELYITHSKFDNAFLQFTLAYIVAIDNCFVLVTRSHFSNKGFPNFVVAFEIGIFTNLVVFDNIFEGKHGLNFYIVNGYNNATIYLVNCRLYKVSGFRASNKTSIFIQDSTIAHCINTLQEGFIQISGKSTLNISNTTITGNSIIESSSIILIQSQSSLNMFDSFYSNNIMASHIVVENDSHLKIKRSDFFNNTIVDTYYRKLKGLVITVKNNYANKNYTETSGSNVFVQGTVFRRNTKFEEKFLKSENSLFSLQSSKLVALIENTFVDNHHLAIISMTGMKENYLKVINCTFKDNFGNSFRTYHVTDVIIANSYFKRLLPKHFAHSAGIKIKYALTVRVLNSTFNCTRNETQIGFPLTLQMDTVALYTTNSTFVGKHKLLRTNTKNFLTKAEFAGFIYRNLLPKINHAETPYASGNALICEFMRVHVSLVYLLLREGNVFSRVCLSFCLSTEGGSLVSIIHDALDHPSGSKPPNVKPGEPRPRPPDIRSAIPRPFPPDIRHGVILSFLR